MATLTHLALVVPDLDEAISFYAAYCGLKVVHDRTSDDSGGRVVWVAEPGRERELVLVLIAGRAAEPQSERDYSHVGFALASQDEVDAIAERARSEGRLVWPPRREDYPVGYYCGIRDPAGRIVEFSHGQPLGPGAPDPYAD